MSVKFSNNATTELASSIGTSDTSITVVDASKFPILTAGDYTYVTLDTDTASPTREIVKVTAISGNVLTVTRGQDGTSPASFAAGTKVELRLTAALLNDVAGANPSGEPIGFPDKSQTTITFDSGTRTFSITPTGASFDVYCKGVKYTYTAVQLVTIPNTTGLHFIYFSASGVLSAQMSYFTWEEHAPTAYVYWNATTQQAIYFADERHGITLDWQTHEYLHRTRGAAIANGFAASGYTTTGLGATDADAQIDIGGGTFFDEDMQVDIVSTNTPVAGTWQQDLSGPARIPVLYLSGSAWVIDAPTNFPFKVVSSVPQYNLYSGGTWSTASVTNNSYFVSWILATNNLTYPVVSIISQAPTNQVSVAEAMTFEGLNLNGFPSVEFRPLYKVIYQYKDGFANSVKSSTIAVYDLRSISSAGVAAALVQDHGNLSGLTDDDHPQYVHTSEVRTPSAAVKNSFFPSQVGQTGKYLSTDGTNTVWEPAPSGSLNFTGDVTGTGSTGSSTTLTLAASGVVAGQYTKVTVDAKGRVTAGTSVTSSDVTTALGYTPYNATNPAGYTTNVGTVTSVSGTGTVSGLTLTGSVTSSGSLTLGGTLSLTSGQVTSALGFTPANKAGDTFTGPVLLTQNPVGTTYGNGVSATPTYYLGQGAGNDDAWKIYGESDGGNQVRLVFETNDDNDANEKFLFRYKKTYGDFAATDLLAFDTNGITFKGNSVAHGGNFTGFALSSGQVTTALGYTPATVHRGSATVSSAGYTCAFTVTGSGLASAIRFTVQGTTNSVVVNSLVDLVVNHHQDIVISSLSGIYTVLTVRVVSDSNDSFAVLLTTNSANAANLAIDVFPLNNETITFTSSNPYSGSTLTHQCNPGFATSATGGMSGDINASGAIYASGGNTVLHAGNYSSGYFKTINGSSIIGTGDLTVSDSTKLPLTGGNVSGSINLTNRLTGILVNSSSQSSDGGSIAIQQVTAEGWTGIFADYEPYTGWGLWHDNPNNYFCFTAESATNGLRSFTVPSRVSGNRTAYEKVRIEQGSGDVRVGGSVYITTSGHLALHAGNYNDYAPKKDGTGAQGTWGISITGSSSSASYDLAINQNLNATGATNSLSAFNAYYPSGGGYNQPIDGGQHFRVLQFGRYNTSDANYWRGQIAQSFYEDRMWFRKEYSQTWGNWRELIHDGNYSNFAVALSNDQTISGIKTFSTQIRANSIMGQEQWEGTITVAGDANTYYPVTWWGGDQDAVTEIEIFRYYAATAPWNPIGTGVHQGALTLKFACNFGGWGGANYDIRVDHFRETYTTMVAEISRFGNERGFCVWLRGGTATYQIRVKGRNYGPTISYSAYDPGGNGSGVSPRTDLPRANLKNHFSGGTLYSDGSAVVTAANYNSYSPSLSGTGANGTWNISITGNAATAGGRSIGFGAGEIPYLGGTKNLVITNPETYSGEVRLGAAWGRGGLYGSNNVTVSTSGSVIDHVHSDIVTMRHLHDSNGSRVIIGTNQTSTPYTLVDTNARPTLYMRGQYPVLVLDHTATSNGSHGPTIQFTHDGAGARQWVVGTNGTGTRIDFGYADSGTGNSNYNPHNGISGYLGTTWMTVRNNGRIGLGWAGDWGDYGTVGEPSYPFHFVAGMENGHSYLFRNTGGSNGAGAIFVNNSGGHSWGIVSEFRIDGSSGSDRPSLLFSTGYNSDTWSVGFGYYGDSNFRIRYDHGHRNGGWGTTALEIDRSKRTYIHQGALYQSGDWVNAFQNTPTSSRTFHGDVSSGGPTGTWWFYDSMRHSNGTSYWGTQIAYGWEDNANNIYQRNVTGNSWSGWVRYLNSNNYSSYALPLGGGTVTGQATFSKTDDHAISVGTIRGRAVGSRTGEYIHLYERVHIGSPNGWGAVDAPSNGLSTYGSIHVSTSNGTGNGIILADDGDIVDLNDAYCSMRFSYGVRVFSANRGGSAVHTLHSNGNFTASGNVTAYSDETLKKDWAEIQGGYVEKLANLKCGTYTRIDSGFRQAGVSAQGMREILQEVVGEDDKGILSLAYGNAAMVSAVELAKELVMLKKELAELKSRLH